jgi:hypothetical protein
MPSGKSIYRYHNDSGEYILWDGESLFYAVPFDKEEGVVKSYLIYTRAINEPPELVADEKYRGYYEGSYFPSEVVSYMLLFGKYCFQKGREHSGQEISNFATSAKDKRI